MESVTEEGLLALDDLSDPRKTPCRGPECRQAPDESSPSLPFEQRPPVPDEWVGKTFPVGDQKQPRLAWTIDDGFLILSWQRERVDRPPEELFPR
jgi:hypothetical protein